MLQATNAAGLSEETSISIRVDKDDYEPTESNNENNEYCAVFDIFSPPELKMPCAVVGSQTYEIGFNFTGSDSLVFQIDMDYVKEIQPQNTEGCAAFLPLENKLHVPCLDAGRKYWVDRMLQNQPGLFFQLSDFGELNE